MRSLSVLIPVLFVLTATSAGVRAAQTVAGTRGASVQSAVINFTELAAKEAGAAARGVSEPAPYVHDRPRLPAPNVVPGAEDGASAPPAGSRTSAGSRAPTWPGAAFLALPDNNTSIPPDTNGAVGPTHLMVTCNTQVRIQQRDGTVLSTVGLSTFWASTGNPSVFDPKVLYDPFADRWMFTATANARSANSSVMIGVSQTSDPTGNWNLFRIDADGANQVWADFPTIGFNNKWIAVSANMFTLSGDSFGRCNLWVFDKNGLYTQNQANFTLFQDNTGGATLNPALTYDNSENTLFVLDVFNTSNLRISTVTGSVDAEVYTTGTDFANSPQSWGFAAPGFADFLPQMGTASKIDAGDHRLRNTVYRNGSLWTAHTVFLPPGAVTRAAIQWWEVNPATGAVLQRGRLEDATNTKHFAYPSIAVNQNDDMMIGYSRFGADQFASANYAMRLAADGANTLRQDTVFKEGEAPYFKTFGGSRNRWGDYSNTVVDPVNDDDIWAIQEYAGTPSGGFDRWSTFWGMVDLGTPAGSATAQITSELTLQAVVNVPFVYNATATGTPPITITYTPADFATLAGIGLSAASEVLSGTPNTVGVFNITLQADNTGAGGGIDSQNIELTVLEDTDADGQADAFDPDDDNDGFPDDLEDAFGTDSLDASDTPFGGAPAGDGILDASRLQKIQIKLTFNKANADLIAMKGALPVPDGFDVAGQEIAIFFGGVVKVFTLDPEGNFKDDFDSFKVKVKASQGVVLAQEAKFTAKLAKQDFQTDLADEGLANGNIDKEKEVEAVVVFAGTVLSGNQLIDYVAKQDKSGKGKLIARFGGDTQ
ncbi:MAG: hypothetical protein L6R28_19370 [Planctomycetes bacterium]|nr:hypothetical protein [Planctomycetota bacterium]